MTHKERKPDGINRGMDFLLSFETKCTKKLSRFFETNRFLKNPITNAVFFSALSLGAAGAITHSAVKLHRQAPLVDRLEFDKVLAEESVEFKVRSIWQETVKCIDIGKPLEACKMIEQQKIAQVGEEAASIKKDLENLKHDQTYLKANIIIFPILLIGSGVNAVMWWLSRRRKENQQPEMHGEVS